MSHDEREARVVILKRSAPRAIEWTAERIVDGGIVALPTDTVYGIAGYDTRILSLVAPKAEFVYLPSLIWIPTGLRQGKDMILPLDTFLKDHAVEFVAGRVTGLEDGGRTVVTDQGRLANDALVIASGARFIKKLPGIEHALTLCEGVASAEAIRERLDKLTSGRIALGFGGNPNEPSAMRGGPMFEFLFNIDAQLKREGRRDRFELVFFNPSNEPGPSGGKLRQQPLRTVRGPDADPVASLEAE